MRAFPGRDDANTAEFIPGFGPDRQFITDVRMTDEGRRTFNELLHALLGKSFFPPNAHDEWPVDSFEQSQSR